MNKKFWLSLAFIAIMAVTFVFSSLNGMVALDEKVNAAWAQVLNQYKRRTDLIPNLVSTVKGYAAHERETLDSVIAARAKAVQTNVNVNDPQSVQTFMDNQAALSSSLSKLMAIVESYPDLKANQNFLSLQSQLEGCENRIAIARQDYIIAVQKYNTKIRSIPTAWIVRAFTDLTLKPIFTVDEADQQLPIVSFQ